MVGFGEPVLDAVLPADAIEHMAAQAGGGPGAVLRQVGEGGAVVGEHDADLVRERGDDAAQEGGSCGGVGVLVELDVGELRDTVDRQQHVKLAGGEAQLEDVDVDVADRGLGEAAAPRALLLGLGQAGNAVALQAAVERAAGQPRDRVAQASRTSSSGSSVRRRNSRIMASSSGVSTVLRGGTVRNLVCRAIVKPQEAGYGD